MHRTVTLFIASVAFLIAPPLSAADSDADTPNAALESYYSALKKGDTDTAKELTAAFKGIPAEYLDRYTVKYSAGAKAGKLTIKLVPDLAKVDEDCAVVIFVDGDKERPDYDPAFLIKQDGKWKVFLKLTKWEHPTFDLTPDQKERFGALQKWFDTEKDRLYGR